MSGTKTRGNSIQQAGLRMSCNHAFDSGLMRSYGGVYEKSSE